MPDGRRITKTFRRKIDAKQFKAEMELEKKRFDHTGITINGDIPFNEYANDWFEREIKNRKAPRTQECYRSDLKNFIVPICGPTLLKHIGFKQAREMENSMLKAHKSPRTVNKVMTLFKTMLNDAVKFNYLLKNPIKGHPELKEQPKDINYWSKEEVYQFLTANSQSEAYPLYLVALNTGMRLGELLGLCFDRIDFLNRQIRVNRTMTRCGLQNTTKTHKERILPINVLVYDILWKLFQKAKRKDSLVFMTANGEPFDYNHTTQRVFQRDQKRAGLTKIIRFHDLRHTYASHFLMNGGTIYTLQKLLGHQDIVTTQIYAHLDRAYLQEASSIVSFSADPTLPSSPSQKVATILPHLRNGNGKTALKLES